MRDENGGDCAMQSLCRIELLLDQSTDTVSNALMVAIKER